jgi:DNA invertase Pin-like site-specific DNA recombinase
VVRRTLEGSGGVTVSTRVVSYLRVSSKGQIDGDGFARQRSAVNQWITNHSAAHIAEFTEDGISGTSDLINRPALTRLVSYCLEHGPVHAVVVEKADRLARDLIVSEMLIRQFSEMGIRVIEAEGGNDLTAGTDNPTATLIRQVLAAVAQFEKSSVVAKLRVARNRRRAETGRCEGAKPYGHSDSESVVVNAIANLRSEGLTTREIARELDSMGVPSRSGGKWSHSVVARVVSRTRKTEVGV